MKTRDSNFETLKNALGDLSPKYLLRCITKSMCIEKENDRFMMGKGILKMWVPKVPKMGKKFKPEMKECWESILLLVERKKFQKRTDSPAGTTAHKATHKQTSEPTPSLYP